MTIAFSAIVNVLHFSVIDELYHADQIRADIAAMTPEQRSAHAWMTGTLDVLFPIVYGTFFVGMALRFFGRVGPLLALPSVAVIPIDIAEGVVQVLLLNGYGGVIELKEVITPIKLVLFLLGAFIAVVGFCLGLWRSMSQSRVDEI